MFPKNLTPTHRFTGTVPGTWYSTWYTYQVQGTTNNFGLFSVPQPTFPTSRAPRPHGSEAPHPTGHRLSMKTQTKHTHLHRFNWPLVDFHLSCIHLIQSPRVLFRSSSLLTSEHSPRPKRRNQELLIAFSCLHDNVPSCGHVFQHWTTIQSISRISFQIWWRIRPQCSSVVGVPFSFCPTIERRRDCSSQWTPNRLRT